MTARRLNWILAIMLAVMTTVAALTAGAAVYMVRNPGIVWAATQAVETYPRPLRRTLRERLRAEGRQIAPELAAYVRARQQMFEAMSAEPFDRDALEAAMAEARRALGALQARSHAVLADTVEDADPHLRRQITPPRRDAIDRLERFSR